MVIQIAKFSTEDPTDFTKIVNEYMDAEVFICWPHLTEGKVVAISTKDNVYDETKIIKANDARVFDLHVKGITTQ